MNVFEICASGVPCTNVVIIHVLGVIGGILLIYGVFLEQEKRQDLIKMLGAFCLLIYAIYTGDKLFMAAMGGLSLASLIEFVEIYTGLHKHSPEDLKRYKKMR